jgi:hypothetical protein
MKHTWLSSSIAVFLLTSSARADGIDLVPYFTRVGGYGHSFYYVAAMVLLFMVINYALNFLVIGLPVIRLGCIAAPTVATGLIAFTLLGQMADRIGAVLAGLLTGPITAFFRLPGEGAWVAPLLILNFLCSGLAIVALALYFLRRRWRIRPRLSWIIALVAGLVTNPAWVIGLWFITGA